MCHTPAMRIAETTPLAWLPVISTCIRQLNFTCRLASASWHFYFFIFFIIIFFNVKFEMTAECFAGFKSAAPGCLCGPNVDLFPYLNGATQPKKRDGLVFSNGREPTTTTPPALASTWSHTQCLSISDPPPTHPPLASADSPVSAKIPDLKPVGPHVTSRGSLLPLLRPVNKFPSKRGRRLSNLLRRRVNCASDGTIGSLQPRGGPHSSLSPTGRAWLSTAASSSSSSASVAVLKLILGVVCGRFHW